MDFPNPPVWELDCGERIVSGMEITCPHCLKISSYYGFPEGNHPTLMECLLDWAPPREMLQHFPHVTAHWPTLLARTYRKKFGHCPKTPLTALYSLVYDVFDDGYYSGHINENRHWERCLEWFHIEAGQDSENLFSN